MRFGFVALGLFLLKGGTERFSVNISHEMALRGHECYIFHSGNHIDNPVYQLNDQVKTVALYFGDTNEISQSIQKIKEVQLDCLCLLLSAKQSISFLNICKDTGTPILISERSSPYAVENIIWNRSERIASLSVADGIHLQSRDYLSSLPEILRSAAIAIPNPAPAPILMDRESFSSDRKTLLSVARLDDGEKQLSLLIRAFATLAENFPDWDCCICGGGICYDAYSSLIAKLGLESRIKLTGPVEDIDSYYSAADLFCLPSLFEGFPNALLEAQSHGLPAVGFAECGGVNEIIIHGENGFLAERMNVEALATSLYPLMEDSSLRQKMTKKTHSLLSRYEAKDIYDRWEELLTNVATNKNRTRLDNPLPLADKQIQTIRDELFYGIVPSQKLNRIKGLGDGNLMLYKLRSKLALEKSLHK
jgi:glycosyltransferase involved in cell wall biosynthesis